MKKKIISLLMAATLLASVGGSMAMSVANAISTNANSLTIAVDEDFGDLNILTMTEHSYSADHIFTMAYDTLLTLDDNGDFQPGLVESWVTYEGDSGTVSGSIGDVEVSNKVFRDPPGWEEIPFDHATDDQLLPDDGESSSYRTVYTLRSGLTFQSGEDFTAQSIKDLIDFAKLQPINTLIYKQWAPISINIIADDTFSFSINLTSFPMGNMDFMYTLASPIGSMINVSGFENGATLPELPKGTGAYEIDTVTENSVTLTRYANWWNTSNPVTTQTVTFEYPSGAVSNSCWSDLQNGIYDAVVMSDSFSINEKDDMALENEYDVYTIDHNPLAVSFNPSNELFADYRTRTAFSLAIDKAAIYTPPDENEDENENEDEDESKAAHNMLGDFSNGIWSCLDENEDSE